jgi:hypothetical protein
MDGFGADVLAYFDLHAPNGPTEAINGRPEALRRSALEFRNLTHYRILTTALRQPGPADPEEPDYRTFSI